MKKRQSRKRLESVPNINVDFNMLTLRFSPVEWRHETGFFFFDDVGYTISKEFLLNAIELIITTLLLNLKMFYGHADHKKYQIIFAMNNIVCNEAPNIYHSG